MANPNSYPKVNLNKPVSQWGGGTGFMPSLGGTAETAARAGLGVATGGTSEIIAQVLNLIPSIFQGITGLSQMRQARDIEAQNLRPEAVVAPSVDKLVNYSYGRTLATDIPGGTIARNEIKGATAAGLRAATERGEGSEAFGFMGELVGREQNAFSDFAGKTAREISGYQGDYMNALGVRANEENRVWDWNKGDPYLQAAAIAQQLRDSGLKNINSGVKNVFGSSAEALASRNQDFNSSLLYGKGNSGTSGKYTMDDIMAAIKSLEK